MRKQKQCYCHENIHEDIMITWPRGDTDLIFEYKLIIFE